METRRKDKRDSGAEGSLMGKDKEEGLEGRDEEGDRTHERVVICLTKEESDGSQDRVSRGEERGTGSPAGRWIRKGYLELHGRNENRRRSAKSQRAGTEKRVV